MKKRWLTIPLALMAATVMSGCASDENVSYLLTAPSTEICLVDNPEVRAQVFLEIRRALIDKGLTVHRIEAGDLAAIRNCQQTVYYEATFGSSWTYSPLRHAKLELIEKARHNSSYTVEWDERTQKTTLFDRVEDASVEIRQLVDRLFPSDIAWN